MDSRRAQQSTRRMPAQSQPITEEEMLNEGEYDDVWPVRPASSARRYQGLSDVRHETGRRADIQAQAGPRAATRSTGERHTIPPRRTAMQTRLPTRATTSEFEEAPPTTTTQARASTRARPAALRKLRRPHWLFFAGLLMFAMILSWVALSAVSTWWQTTLDDWHYGRPRTYQTDAVVGHRDSAQNPSHFIAMNLNRHIIIIEIPGGDVAKSVVYTGPTLLGPGQDLTPVTLSFQDINHDGKPNMIVNIQGSQFVFLNQNGTFVPATPNINSTG